MNEEFVGDGGTPNDIHSIFHFKEKKNSSLLVRLA